MTGSRLQAAPYGAAAVAHLKGELPNPFPRVIGGNALKYVQEVLESGLLLDMPGRFEAVFAEAYGVKHCIAVPGCTNGLIALAAALSFEPGDEVIVSPITDFGTILGLLVENYIPVFPDTEPGTINMSAATIEPCITDRTRAILCVHMSGLICDMDPINELAARHGLMVLEDVCQAVFGKYKGRLAGTLSKAAAFSFDAEKTMGSDVGGCVVTNDDHLAERLRLMGQSRGAVAVPGYGRIHNERGYALRMPACTAAVTLAQLEIAGPNVAQRDRMARLLTRLIEDIPDITPMPIPDYMDVYSCWMMGFSIDQRAFNCSTAEFAAQLELEGIPGAGMGMYYLLPDSVTWLSERASEKEYPYSMPPASREYSYGSHTCPNAHKFLESFVRWATFCEKYEPEHCELAADMIRHVADRNRI